MILTKNLKKTIQSIIAVTINLSLYTILYYLQDILHFFSRNAFDYLFGDNIIYWLLITVPKFIVGCTTICLIIQLLSRITSFVLMDVLLYTEDTKPVQSHQSIEPYVNILNNAEPISNNKNIFYKDRFVNDEWYKYKDPKGYISYEANLFIEEKIDINKMLVVLDERLAFDHDRELFHSYKDVIFMHVMDNLYVIAFIAENDTIESPCKLPIKIIEKEEGHESE